jgi:tetratricopeptide (TPR) repeat protein
MENQKLLVAETTGFLEQWKKHPLSIPVIIIILNLSFFLVLIQGNLDSNKIHLAYISSIFLLLMFLIVVCVLIWRKFVFYNITELIILEVNRHMRDIQNALANIEIGIGVAFDDLQALPISEEVVSSVRRFEILSSLMKNVDYEPETNDSTNKALAKYYFRYSKYDKALLWLEKIKNKNDSDFNFIKGLLMWKKGESKKSREYLTKSSHPKAKYYNYVTYVSTYGGDLSKEGYDQFINEVSAINSSLHCDIYAQINLSVAYCRKALLFPPDGAEIDVESLQKALKISEHLIMIEDHPFAYFNAACFVSLLGKFSVALDDSRPYDEPEYKRIVLSHLERALEKKPSLLNNAICDSDFEWLRKKDEQGYFLLIGKTYYHQSKK